MLCCQQPAQAELAERLQAEATAAKKVLRGVLYNPKCCFCGFCVTGLWLGVDIGASMVRIGFWGYIMPIAITRSPQNSIGHSLGPYIDGSGFAREASGMQGFGVCACYDLQLPLSALVKATLYKLAQHGNSIMYYALPGWYLKLRSLPRPQFSGGGAGFPRPRHCTCQA